MHDDIVRHRKWAEPPLVPYQSTSPHWDTSPSLQVVMQCVSHLSKQLCWYSNILNSLASERFGSNFTIVFFKFISWIDILIISCKIGLRSQNPIDDKSKLVQVMAWHLAAPSHYLNQCWRSSMTPYGITSPQYGASLRPEQNGCQFAENIFKIIFLNEKFFVWIHISLGFVPEGPINNYSALIQVMALCQTVNKPLPALLFYLDILHHRGPLS